MVETRIREAEDKLGIPPGSGVSIAYERKSEGLARVISLAIGVAIFVISLRVSATEKVVNLLSGVIMIPPVWRVCDCLLIYFTNRDHSHLQGGSPYLCEGRANYHFSVSLLNAPSHRASTFKSVSLTFLT